MSTTNIRTRRRSKHYMAPVLLDHRSQKRLITGMVVALCTVFVGGYLLGFNKAETRLAAGKAIIPLALAEQQETSPVELAPQPPEKKEPGETIDVDAADNNASNVEPPEQLAQLPEPAAEVETRIESRSVPDPAPAPVKPPVVDKAPEAKAEEIKPPEDDALKPDIEQKPSMAMGGPAASDPEQEDALLIQDTASEENAKYTIQVGVYGQLDNAERKVEELVAFDLSGYLTEYRNRKDELRYNVRFGYFANHSSAKKALANFENKLAGTGYILRIKRQQQVAETTSELATTP